MPITTSTEGCSRADQRLPDGPIADGVIHLRRSYRLTSRVMCFHSDNEHQQVTTGMAGMQQQQPAIVVTRPAGNYRDSLRAYRVVVDGNQVGKVVAGGSLRVELAVGRHEVWARLDWSGSKRAGFELADGDVAEFEVKPAGGPFAWFQALGRTTYITISRLA